MLLLLLFVVVVVAVHTDADVLLRAITSAATGNAHLSPRALNREGRGKNLTFLRKSP